MSKSIRSGRPGLSFQISLKSRSSIARQISIDFCENIDFPKEGSVFLICFRFSEQIHSIRQTGCSFQISPKSRSSIARLISIPKEGSMFFNKFSLHQAIPFDPADRGLVPNFPKIQELDREADFH